MQYIVKSRLPNLKREMVLIKTKSPFVFEIEIFPFVGSSRSEQPKQPSFGDDGAPRPGPLLARWNWRVRFIFTAVFSVELLDANVSH